MYAFIAQGKEVKKIDSGFEAKGECVDFITIGDYDLNTRHRRRILAGRVFDISFSLNCAPEQAQKIMVR